MLVYSVVSPNVFEPSEFEQPGYRDQVEQFFKALESNAVLLVDPQASLLTDIERKLAKLPTKYRQFLSIRLEDLKKSMNAKHQITNVVKLNASRCKTDSGQSTIRRCSAVHLAATSNAIFLSEEDRSELDKSGFGDRALRMIDYTRSEFENRRRFYMETIPSIDEMSIDEFNDILVRTTKYSSWLRLYDKQLGKGTNISGFRRSIDYILRTWIDACHAKPTLCEIYTTECETIKSTDSDQEVARKIKSNSGAIDRFREDLLDKLKGTFGIEFKAFVKKDPEGLFHARHL